MLVGAVVAEMYRFAGELRRRRESLDAATRRLTLLVESAQWVGPDRDRFVREWSGTHVPSLRQVMDDLLDAASRISAHAQAQEEASR